MLSCQRSDSPWIHVNSLGWRPPHVVGFAGTREISGTCTHTINILCDGSAKLREHIPSRYLACCADSVIGGMSEYCYLWPTTVCRYILCWPMPIAASVDVITFTEGRLHCSGRHASTRPLVARSGIHVSHVQQYTLQLTTIRCKYQYINRLHARYCSRYRNAALMLYGTQGSVRGLNRWGYKWLPLSPKSIAKQHRWRENSYGFKLTNRWRIDIFSVLFWGFNFGLKNSSNSSGTCTKHIGVNVSSIY